ncbi:protease inhibitor I9 family protein, partial [Streptomyces sodiiphilus]|uniref:protease inhibitor I9 family protein n=1 Tax=Streptomyces sodiiphilus TaxID=226217 RepID=UPI0031D19434
MAAAAVVALGVGAALPAAASAAPVEPTAFIANADSPDAIDGSYIVTLRDTVMTADSKKAEKLADKYDAEITETYTHALNGYAIEADEKQAMALAADPAVESVVANETVSITATQTNPPSWGLDRIDQ